MSRRIPEVRVDRTTPDRCAQCGSQRPSNELRIMEIIARTRTNDSRRALGIFKYTVCKLPAPCGGHLQMSMEG